MWLVRLALNRPYTFVVLALLLFLITPVAMLQTPVDIFPSIDIPVVSVIWTYTGLPPQEMADRITSVYERVLTTTVGDIEHVESQSLNGVSVIKVFLQPGGSVDAAIAQLTASGQTVLKQLPPGVTPPFILRYSASTVPILQLGLAGNGFSEQQLNDFGNNFIRPQLATVPGAAVPNPFGGKVRQVMVDIDLHRLQSKGLSAVDVVNAIQAQNVILPSGTAKIGTTEYNVGLNGSPDTVDAIGRFPIRTAPDGGTIFINDVAHVRDGFAVQQNIVKQDGQRGALLTIERSGRTSTLAVVAGVKAALPSIAATLPKSLVIKPMSDQSMFVKASLMGVVREGVIAGVLTSVMILLFIGSWRSTLIIAVSIPLAIVTSLLLLSALGQTINVMTLGGLALAVGVLVDDATVEIENTQRNLALSKPLRQAILDGAQEIAMPAFVSTLCISIVFVPMFFLSGVAGYLFLPLAEAVVFALCASYFYSRTIIPTLVSFLLPAEVKQKQGGQGPGWFAKTHRAIDRGFEGLKSNYARLLGACIARRTIFLAGALFFFLASLSIVPFLGEDFFPAADAGQIRLHLRAKTGTRLEETARLVDQVEREISSVIPPTELSGTLDNIGLPTSGINLAYSNNGFIGNADAELLISLTAKHHPTRHYVKVLRERLPLRFPGTDFSFEPADIVAQTLNFGVPAPIDIQIVGPDQLSNFAVASRIAAQVRNVPGAVDVRVQQAVDQPRLQLTLDRNRLQRMGLTERDVAGDVLVALSSSFQTAPNFWLSPKNGVAYSIAVQAPQYTVHSLDSLHSIPVAAVGTSTSQLLSNLSTMSRFSEAAVVSHYDVQPVMEVFASTQGRDLGAVATDIARITKQISGSLPRGSKLVTRGQVVTMQSSLHDLFLGLAFSVVLVYCLLVVNFQSWAQGLIIIAALPAALAGICWMLLLSRTSLSVPALMGTIMSVGVATSNSVLVITFANERFVATGDSVSAAIEAGQTRLRPVIMTALAMVMGMIPMALGLGDGGEQNAPLGRAVIGGLLFATAGTLFFVPTVFSAIQRPRPVPGAPPTGLTQNGGF
ncbi:efflux RND transporter permease subunit [Terriglobus roseus]|uniref:Multidrug efflux pump subunit AcrB n=1 Tax=Terriglobus roseus TaxID=392734 RepID=A0A1H4J2M8_9BACT|nr:efflux RND transporter permease subunit [Terriglobus roseus]SEB39832.1 Multidrug efflux pump subunit AcrB [Terriglobus roseus]